MPSNQNINVIKASGAKVAFEENKLRKSLVNSGVSDDEISLILEYVDGLLYEGISTKEIYKKAYSLIKKSSKSNAARYKLKKAIFELGPSGFPFEILVGELLKLEGYEAEVGVMIEGHCIRHEVDVVATKGNSHYLVECKFHGESSRICNVKIPLYINSRFIDIQEKLKSKKENHDVYHQGWIVTNTRFSDDASKYGECMGLQLIGWDSPRNGSLKSRIDKAGLHPVTCLSNLTNAEKQILIDKKIVVCKSLLNNKNILNQIGVINPKRQQRILSEIKGLCNHKSYYVEK